MAAFATPAELASHLQVASVDTATANLLLNEASSAIRTYCGWSISSEDVVDEEFDGTGTRNLWIETLRLTLVASLVENGLPLTEGVDYDWTRYGKLVRNGCWPRTARSVVISYTHGYTTVPDVVKGVCLDIAGRKYNNPQSTKSGSRVAGPFTETFAYQDNPASLLSAAEMDTLGKFKLEPIG
jgi:hypothetical protein